MRDSTDQTAFLCKACSTYIPEITFNKRQNRCMGCLASIQKKWRDSASWSKKQLRRLKHRYAAYGVTLSLTEADIIHIFHRCENRCIISGEEDKERLAVVVYPASDPLTRDLAIVVSQEFARLWSIRRTIHRKITPEMVKRYVSCVAIN